MEMLHTYEQKSVSRDELVRRAREKMKVLVQEMRKGVCSSPEIERLMVTLSSQLETAKGKKVYGYLGKDTKATVDEIVDELEKLPVVNVCYEQWWLLQCQVMDYYSEQPKRERPKLSEQKEFRQIKNAVIQEAENIRLGVLTFEDEGMEDEDWEEAAPQFRTLHQMAVMYRQAKVILYDGESKWSEQESAVQSLERLWEWGFTAAAHQLGKCYREGLGVIPDDEKAEMWFRLAAESGLGCSQYALGKLLQSENRIEEALHWYEKASANGNQYADYRLGKIYLTGEGVSKDKEKAVVHLTASAEAENQYAQYALGKYYLEQEDYEQAHTWFTRSAAQGNTYAQFFLERWDTIP